VTRLGERRARRQRIERMRLALEAMDAGPRAIFERVWFDGMDYAAIADDLGISIDAVEQGLVIALAHFDREMGKGE
jgi:DNA-directed RNA polymerase specialized sigma24 family protein